MASNNIEQDLRIKLAAAHHIVHYSGWDDLLATHLSVRVPDSPHLLITPMNVAFENVTASRLIKCDFSGNVIEENGETLMPQAINIHGEIYKQSNSIMSAMHTHSVYGVAVASLDCGFLFQNQRALRFYDDIAYCEYNGLALSDEGKHIVDSLGDKKTLILRCHGLLTTGVSIEEAMYLLHYLELACETQIKVLSTGQSTVEIPKALCQQTKAQLDAIRKPELEFAAMVERIEGRSSVDYRD